MREQGLRPAEKRHFRPKVTESRHPHRVAENWPAKVPAPERPGMMWQSDFTCIETGEGWLHLVFTAPRAGRAAPATIGGVVHAPRRRWSARWVDAFPIS